MRFWYSQYCKFQIISLYSSWYSVGKCYNLSQKKIEVNMNKWSSGVISKRTLTAWCLSALHFMSLWFKIWSTFKVAKRVQCTFTLSTELSGFCCLCSTYPWFSLFGSIWKQNPTVENSVHTPSLVQSFENMGIFFA